MSKVLKRSLVLLSVFAACQAFGQWSADPGFDAIHGKPDSELLQLLHSSKDLMIRHACALTLGQHHVRAAVPELIAILNDRPSDRPLRQIGQRVGSMYDGPNRDVMNSSRGGLRMDAASALGRIGDRRAIGPLIASLQRDPSDRVAASAARAIASYKGPGSTKALVGALRDSSGVIRVDAARGLGILGDRSASVPLIRAMSDKSDTVREQAATSLGMIGARNAVKPLAAHLRDESSSVRTRCAEALAKLGDPSVIPALKAMAEVPPKDIANAPGQWRRAQAAASEAIRRLSS